MGAFRNSISDSRLGRLLFVAPIAALVWCAILKAALPTLDLLSMVVALGMLLVSTLVFLMVDLRARGPESIDDVRADYRALEKSSARLQRLVEQIAKSTGEENIDRLVSVVRGLSKNSREDLAPQLKEVSGQLKSAEARLRDAENQLARVKAELEGKNVALGSARERHQREQLSLEQQVSALLEERSASKAELQRLQTQYSAQDIELQRVRNELVRSKQLHEEANISLQSELVVCQQQLAANPEAREAERLAFDLQARLAQSEGQCLLLQEHFTQSEASMEIMRREVAALKHAREELLRERAHLLQDNATLGEVSVDRKALNAMCETCFAQIAAFRSQLFVIVSIYTLIISETAEMTEETEKKLEKHVLWDVFRHVLRDVVPLHEVLRVFRRLPPSLFRDLEPRKEELALRHRAH